MKIDLLLIFTLIISINFTLVAFLILYKRLFNEIKQIKKQEEDLKEHIYQQQAAKASDTWSNIEKDIVLYFQKIALRYADSIEKTTKDFTNVYQQELREIKKDNISLLKDISNSIEKDTQSIILEITQSFKREIANMEESSAKKIDMLYQQTQNEVQSYKEAKLKEIDDHVAEILQNTIEEALGKSLDIQSHQDLILDALEKAKKDKFFEDGNK